MDPMLSRVIFLLLAGLHSRPLPCIVILRLLIDPNAVPSKNSSLLRLLLQLCPILGIPLRLHIIQRRREVHIHISINDTNGIILIFRRDLQYIDLKLVIEYLDADGVSFVQACEVSELILQDCFGVLHVDEFGLMGLQLYHVTDLAVFFPHVAHQGYGSWGSGFWKLQHFEHPIGYVAQSFLCNKLQHSTVGHLRSIFQAKYHRILVLATDEMVQFIECGRGKQDLIALLDVLPKRKGSRIHSQPMQCRAYSRKNDIFGPIGTVPGPGRFGITFLPPMPLSRLPPNMCDYILNSKI